MTQANKRSEVHSPDLSVIIVNFNGGELLRSCLSALFAQKGVSFEAFLVDNGSHDNSAERARDCFPDLTVLENAANPGYAVANNQAISDSRGRYILLLNPDVVLEPDALATAVQLMDAQPAVGILGPRILLPDGTLDKPCRRSFKTPGTYFYMLLGLTRAFPKHPQFGKYYLSWLDERQPTDVDAVIGAFLLIRREVIDEIGLLDERFYMYCEDEDWCFRAKRAGWRIRYEPDVLVTHYKGSSSAQRPRRMIYERHKAILQYHGKNIAPQYTWPVNAAVYAGILASLAISILRNTFRPRLRSSAITDSARRYDERIVHPYAEIPLANSQERPK